MASTFLPNVYATDEDVVVEGGADFGTIVPISNLIAQGSDGVLGTPNLWTLSSASNDFAAQGVAAGMVVQFGGVAFKQTQNLAVETVSSSAISLRRCGMESGVGVPPLPANGAGLTFKILTLRPQIENTAYKLNEQFAVDPNITCRTPGDIYDQRIFRRLTALRVLYLQYMNLNRSKAGDFADKLDHYRSEYSNELATATLRWGPQGTSQPPSNRFGMRLSR